MSAHHAIDTILLDLGGVIIDVDYHASARAFRALGFEEFDALYSQAKQDHLFDGFEIGALSPAQFRDRIRQLFRQDLTDREIDACWNAMLGSVPMERIDLIDRLKKRYQVLLLSNTNAIHVSAFTEMIRKENGIADFKGLFHGAYYSCEMGLRKPDAAAFHHVLEQHDAEAERTLFIDDSMQHVIGARAAGLHAQHLELAHENVRDLVKRLGLFA
ncbi:MAG: HAD family phosphatase [Flavobacteriales bacterium]|nr:HAD family phosphatase [Flavobacteriales bacterium]MBK9073637.1 HAD family phosphatase [Flavobacteriales bacterium]